jgi:hypothetical protein
MMLVGRCVMKCMNFLEKNEIQVGKSINRLVALTWAS